VNVLGEVHDRFADAQQLPFARAAATLEVRERNLAPQLTDCGALLRIGDDDEVPGLRVGRRRRLLRKLEALEQPLPLDRPREVESLAWFEALALWKAAVFCEAIYGRFIRGELGEEDTRAALFETGVPLLAATALETISK